MYSVLIYVSENIACAVFSDLLPSILLLSQEYIVCMFKTLLY